MLRTGQYIDDWARWNYAGNESEEEFIDDRKHLEEETDNVLAMLEKAGKKQR